MDKRAKYNQRRKRRLKLRMDSAQPDEKKRLAVAIYKNCFRQDADDDDIDWITVNGTHTPLQGGNAIGGGKLTGKNFSGAKSIKTPKKSSATSVPKGSSSPAAQKAFSDKMKQEKEDLLKESNSNKSYAMYECGFLTYDEGVEVMHNGNVDEVIDQYYDIMEQNGNTESEKPLSDNSDNLDKEVESGKYPDYTDGRLAMTEERTGLSTDECKEMNKEISKWVGGEYCNQDVLDKFVESDHTYDGNIYRGMHFELDGSFDDFMKNVQVGGTITVGENGGCASWSSDEQIARLFAHQSDPTYDSVTINCVANRTSAPIGYLNTMGEDEVLSHSKAQWTVLNVDTFDKYGGEGRHANITVVECGNYRSGTNGDGRMDADETDDDIEPVSMDERWEKTNKDFIAIPPKKKYKQLFKADAAVDKYYQRRKQRLDSRMKEEKPANAKRLALRLYKNYFKKDARFDADGDIDWITVNGTHVPLQNGTAIGGGGLTGKRFSWAISTKTSIKSNTKSAVEKQREEQRAKLRSSFDNAARYDDQDEFDSIYRESVGYVWQDMEEYEKDAVYDYTTGDYTQYNGLLRNSEGDPYFAEAIDSMTDVIDRCELKEDTILFRGTGTYAIENMFGLSEGDLTPDNVKDLIGMTGRDDGFMSTGSVEGTGFTHYPVQLEIMAPAGTKGMYAEPFSAYGDGNGRDWHGWEDCAIQYSQEQETILQRGTGLEIIDASYSNGKYHLQAVVTSQEPKETYYLYDLDYGDDYDDY